MAARSKTAQQTVTIPVRVYNRRTPMIKRRAQKTVAKTGMVGSIGTLLITGFFKFHGAKSLHIYSGFSLLAFTAWHHFLNQPKKIQSANKNGPK